MTPTRIIYAIIALVIAIRPCFAGEPDTKAYPFQLSPITAITSIEKLDKKPTLSDDERSFFEAVQHGKLDKWSFAETCLIASGVTDSTKLKEYTAKLDRIEADARKAIADAKTLDEKGDRLLKFLHNGPMKGGYESKQTDLHAILDNGTFNCVSATALYNVIGRRLGMDLYAVEVVAHVFSVLRDGDRRIDVETTSPDGYTSKDLKTQKGTAPAEQYGGKRREVGELGLASVIAYNHGVGLAEKNRFPDALLANFRSLSLDPANPGAAQNVRATFTQWGLDLSKATKFEEALTVVALGLEIAPKDAVLLNNYKVCWCQYAEEQMKTGKDDDTLTILRRAAKAIP